ncbi:MAG: hypothetical protein PHE21_00485 [Candidatus Dojkabacteria bacterium]|nr:hypothetical protein [Candidatus Dojkabacteria bacterium]
MRKMPSKDILVLLSSNEIKEQIRNILLGISTFNIHFQKILDHAINDIQSHYYKVIVIDEDFRKDSKFNTLMSVLFSEYLNSETVILLNDNSFDNLQFYLRYNITCLIEKPIKKDLLKAIIFCKLELLEQYKNKLIQNYGISLYPHLNYLIVKGCKIYLSKSQLDIIFFLLTNNNPCESRSILKYLSYCRDRDITQSYLSANIAQLKKKFTKHTGLVVIKNRKGFGYYISI